jgi:putative hemolysin
MSDLLSVLIVLALVAGNAFFVIGEYAIITARRSGLTRRADAGDRGARAALQLMDDPVRVISTVQVAITGLSILTGAIGESLIRDMLGDSIPTWLSFLIAFSIVTYLSVVLGELVPKALTLDRAETLAAWVAPPIQVFSVVLRPIVWVLQGSAQLLLRPFGVGEVVAGDSIESPEELRQLVDEAEGSGVIGERQERLLHNVFELEGQQARDVMVPALDVVWLDGDLDVDTALVQVVEQPHSRYVVAEGELDRALGVVHVQQLIAARREDPGTLVRTLVRPTPVVPEMKEVVVLLHELRAQRQRLAIVADEYGGTAGIVAVEDIVERLVGEIDDEYDVPVDELEWIGDGAVRIAGSLNVHDFNRAAETELPEDGPRTVGGLVFSALGRRPEADDAVRLADVDLTVEEIDGPRIVRLRASVPGRPRRAPRTA